MKTKIQSESIYIDTFVEITEKHVNSEKYPLLDEAQLYELQLIFALHLEERILSSILEHCDEDVIGLYKGNTADSPTLDEDFDYERFDWLFSIALNDSELQAKIEADVDEFAREFEAEAHKYWGN